jgi:hypothetical protein
MALLELYENKFLLAIYEDQIRTDKAIRYKYNVSLYNEI